MFWSSLLIDLLLIVCLSLSLNLWLNIYFLVSEYFFCRICRQFLECLLCLRLVSQLLLLLELCNLFRNLRHFQKSILQMNTLYLNKILSCLLTLDFLLIYYFHFNFSLLCSVFVLSHCLSILYKICYLVFLSSGIFITANEMFKLLHWLKLVLLFLYFKFLSIY